ncbi:MAG: hypothetical protein JWQ62_248, partial [Lacunisphaera sp.]|nr:hypothetical protein [Lacunisphaera sp.]
MKFAFKFNPALQRQIVPSDRRFWLLRAVAVRIEIRATPLWTFEIYWRRLFIALAGLAVVLWFLAATALFLWLNLTPRNQVGWLDLAAPWRWSGMRVRRGDTAILTALDEIQAKDYASGFYNLRVGLARSPGNVDGRLTLARMQAGYDPARAVAVLEEGLPFAGNNPKYLAGLLSLYGSLQMPTHALGMIERLLAQNSPVLSPEAQFLLVRAQAALLLQAGRYSEAQAVLATLNPPKPADRVGLDLLQAELLLRSGRAAEARQYLSLHPAEGAPNASRLRQEAEIAIAVGDADALQSALRRIKALAPNDPGPYLYAFQSWQRLKRITYRDAAEQEYYQAFGNSDAAMQSLAALAVNLDLPDVVARIQRVATAGRLSTFAFRVHQTELALRRGEIDQAVRHLGDWENNIETLQNRQRFYPEFIKRLTRATFAGTPDQITFLLAHLSANRGQPLLPVYTLAATVFEKAGNPAAASQVLAAGLLLYPQSDPLLTARDRVAATLAAATPKTRGSTLESSPATVAIMLLPPTAAEARTQLDELLQKDSLAAARDLLRAVRAQKPAWLPAIETDLAAREVELAYLSLDQIASRAAARAYLDRYRGEDDLLRLVAVVPRLAGRNHLGDARLLADEIAAAPAANARIRLALHDLNLADDLAAVAADQAATLAALDRSILAQEWTQAER